MKVTQICLELVLTYLLSTCIDHFFLSRQLETKKVTYCQKTACRCQSRSKNCQNTTKPWSSRPSMKSIARRPRLRKNTSAQDASSRIGKGQKNLTIWIIHEQLGTWHDEGSSGGTACTTSHVLVLQSSESLAKSPVDGLWLFKNDVTFSLLPQIIQQLCTYHGTGWRWWMMLALTKTTSFLNSPVVRINILGFTLLSRARRGYCSSTQQAPLQLWCTACWPACVLANFFALIWISLQ